VSKQQEKRDQAARAAWLYYVGNHTQHDIAEQLGVSRQIAQRLIAYAVEHGLVKVRVTHPVSACLELAESLRSCFRLETCYVVPAPADDAEAVQRMIAVAAAETMERHLVADAPRVVSVGSGRTLRAAIDQLPDLDRPQHRIVSQPRLQQAAQRVRHHQTTHLARSAPHHSGARLRPDARPP